MTRRAYFLRLYRVIRGRGRASLKFHEKGHFVDTRGRFLKICHILKDRSRLTQFLLRFSQKENRMHNLGSRSFLEASVKRSSKLSGKVKNMTKISIF